MLPPCFAAAACFAACCLLVLRAPLRVGAACRAALGRCLSAGPPPLHSSLLPRARRTSGTSASGRALCSIRYGGGSGDAVRRARLWGDQRARRAGHDGSRAGLHARHHHFHPGPSPPPFLEQPAQDKSGQLMMLPAGVCVMGAGGGRHGVCPRSRSPCARLPDPPAAPPPLPPPHTLSLLDMWILWDRRFKKHVLEYAKDEEKFFKVGGAVAVVCVCFGRAGGRRGQMGGGGGVAGRAGERALHVVSWRSMLPLSLSSTLRLSRPPPPSLARTQRLPLALTGLCRRVCQAAGAGSAICRGRRPRQPQAARVEGLPSSAPGPHRDPLVEAAGVRAGARAPHPPLLAPPPLGPTRSPPPFALPRPPLLCACDALHAAYQRARSVND